MNEFNERHERAVAEEFVRHQNERTGTAYQFHGRGADEPVDVEFRDGEAVMHVQVTTAWYDQQHAAWTGRHARGDANAPAMWSGFNPDEGLAAGISAAVARKCQMAYPPNCVLVVAVYPNLTTAEDLEEELPGIEIPRDHPFSGIYVSGTFPVSSDGSQGGYHCWRLDGEVAAHAG